MERKLLLVSPSRMHLRHRHTASMIVPCSRKLDRITRTTCCSEACGRILVVNLWVKCLLESNRSVQVVQVVECMRRSRKETPHIISELHATFKQYGDEYDMVMVNELLEALGKRMDVEVQD